MASKDEYISSLLLSLFLMEGEINRLNQTLELARKGELVYINNPQIAELKAENEQLKIECDMYKTFYRAKHNDIDGKLFKYRQTLREIKAISEKFIKNVSENCIKITPMFLVHKEILDLITKAESEV